jgi:hypothetical protein
MNKKFVFTIIFIFIIILFGAYIIKKDGNITITQPATSTTVTRTNPPSTTPSYINYYLSSRDILGNPETYNLSNSDVVARAESYFIETEKKPPNLNFLFQSFWVDQICKTMDSTNSSASNFICSFVSMEVNNKEFSIAGEVFSKITNKLSNKSASLDAMADTFDSPGISADEFKYKIGYENKLQIIENSALNITTNELKDVFDLINKHDPEVIKDELIKNYKLALNSEMRSNFLIWLNKNKNKDADLETKIMSNSFFNEEGNLKTEILEELGISQPEEALDGVNRFPEVGYKTDDEVDNNFWKDKFGLEKDDEIIELKQRLTEYSEKMTNFKNNVAIKKEKLEAIDEGNLEEFLNKKMEGTKSLGRRISPDFDDRIAYALARLEMNVDIKSKYNISLNLFEKSSALQDECLTKTITYISNLENDLIGKPNSIRKSIIDKFKGSLSEFKNSLESFKNKVSSLLRKLGNEGLEFIKKSPKILIELLFKIPNATYDYLYNLTQEADIVVRNVLERIRNIPGTVVDYFERVPDELVRFWTYIKTTTKEKYLSITSSGSELLQKIKSMSREDFLKSPFKNITFDDFKNFITKIRSSTLLKILNPVSLVKGAIIEPLVDLVKIFRIILNISGIRPFEKKAIDKFIAEATKDISTFTKNLEDVTSKQLESKFESFAAKRSINGAKFLEASLKTLRNFNELEERISQAAAKAVTESEEKEIEAIRQVVLRFQNEFTKITDDGVKGFKKALEKIGQQSGKLVTKGMTELGEKLTKEVVDTIGQAIEEEEASNMMPGLGQIAGIGFFVYTLLDLFMEQMYSYQNFKNQSEFQHKSAMNSFSQDFNQSLNFMYGNSITNKKLTYPIRKMIGPLNQLSKDKFTSFLDETNFNGIDICKIVFQGMFYKKKDFDAQRNIISDGKQSNRPLSSLKTPLFNFGTNSINFNILIKNRIIFKKIISPFYNIDTLIDNSQFDLDDESSDIPLKQFIFSLCKDIYDRLIYNQRRYRLILLNRQQQYINHNNDETYFNKEVFSTDIPKIHNYLLNTYSTKLDYVIQKKIIFYTKIFSNNVKYLSKFNLLIDYFDQNKDTNLFKTSNTNSNITTSKGYEFIIKLKKNFNLNYNIFYNYKIFDSVSQNSQIKTLYNKLKSHIDNKSNDTCFVSQPPDWPPPCTPSPTPSPCSSPPKMCTDTLNYLGSMLYTVSLINKSISNKEKQLIYIDVLKEYAKENNLIYINLLEDDEKIKYDNTFTGIAYQKYFFNVDNIKKTLTFDFNYIDLDGNYSKYSKTFIINADEYTEYNETDANNYLKYWHTGYVLEPTMEFIINLELSFNNQIKEDDFFLGKVRFILKERDDVMKFPPNLNTRKNKVIEMIIDDTNYNYHIELNRDKSDPIAQNIFGYNMSELEILYYGYYDNQIDFEDIFNTRVIALNKTFCNEYKVNFYSQEEDDFQNNLMNNLLNNIGKDINEKTSPSSPTSYPYESSSYEQIVRDINETVNPSVRPIRNNLSENDPDSYWYYEEDNYICVNNKTEKPYDIPSPSNGNLEWKFNTEPINTYDYVNGENSFENWGKPDFSNSVNFINPGFLTQNDYGGFVHNHQHHWGNKAAAEYKKIFSSSQIKDINNQLINLPDYWNNQGLLFDIPKSIILDKTLKPTVSCQEQYENNKKDKDFIDYSCEDNSTNNQAEIPGNPPMKMIPGPDGQPQEVPNMIPNPRHINCSDCFNKIREGKDVSNCGTIPDGENKFEKSKLWCSNKNSENQSACTLNTIKKQELCNPYGTHFNRGWETREYNDNSISYPNYPMKNIDCNQLKNSINKDADVCCTMKSNERSIMSGEDWKLSNKVFPQPAPRNPEFDEYIEKNKWYGVNDSQEGFNLMLKLFKSTFNTFKWNPNALDKNQSYSHYSQKEIDNQGKCVNDFIIPKLWCEEPNFKTLNGIHIWPRKYPKGQEQIDTLYQKKGCSPSPSEFLDNYMDQIMSEVSPTPSSDLQNIRKNIKQMLLNINEDYLPSCSRKPEDNWELIDSWDQLKIGNEKQKGIAIKNIDNVRKTYYNFDDLPETPTPGDRYLKWEDNKCKITEKYCKFYNDERLGQNLLNEESIQNKNIFSHFNHKKDECIINRSPNLSQFQSYIENKSFGNINKPNQEPDGIDLIILDKQKREKVKQQQQHDNMFIEHQNISDMTNVGDGLSLDFGGWMQRNQRSFAGDDDFTDRTSNLLPLD